MPRLFQINFENKIHHLIIIDEQFVVRDDDYISIEIGDDFDWNLHASKCIDCQAFLNSLYKPNFQWCLESQGETFMLSIMDFDLNSHVNNKFQQVTALSNNYSGFAGVRLKLKKELHTISNIDRLLSKFESEEEYKVCQELKNCKKISKRP